MAEEVWFDEDAGPLVRPYAMTGGRTAPPPVELDLVTLVVAVAPADPSAVVDAKYRSILDLCEGPTSIAEISALLDIPLGVVKILVGDLIERRWVIHRATARPSADVMRRVIDGLRRA